MSDDKKPSLPVQPIPDYAADPDDWIEERILYESMFTPE